MGSVGDCYDNAVCETFHASLKKERIYRQSWPSRAAARAAIFEYIEGWYNPRAPALHPGLPLPGRVRATAHRARPTSSAPGVDIGPIKGVKRGLQRVASRRSASICSPASLSSRERPHCSNRIPLRPRHKRSRDQRPRVASPLCSQGTSSLIQHQPQQPRRVVQTGGGPESDRAYAAARFSEAR
jgi:hypothetical protein